MIDQLKNMGHEILTSDAPVQMEMILKEHFALAISYCYRHIISKQVIEAMKGNIVNLHISYLPWNRGANPNYWSFAENTPKGVTLHYVNEKLDQGAVICQELVDLSDMQTYAQTYTKLHDSIQKMFFRAFQQYEHWRKIAYAPSQKGSYHSQRQFLDAVGEHFDWNSNVIQ